MIAFKTSFRDCPRCGGEHIDLLVYTLTRPMRIVGSRMEYGFYGECPKAYEPVMITAMSALINVAPVV